VMTLLRVGFLLLLTSGSVPTGQAKYVEGHLKTSDNWAFLARFCFLSGKGKYEYLIEYEKKLGELKLLLYYDDRTQWPAIYKTDKTCTEKLSVLHPEDNQIVTLSPRTPRAASTGKFETRLIVSCSNFGSFTSSRERWWYIAIANCDGAGRGLDVKYRFRMTNGPPGDFWHEHFSADEMYIPPILLAESIAYSFLLLAVFICAVELKARHLYHCTYRLFTLSVLLQWFGILLLSVTWTKYAVSGIGPFPNFGGIFTSASEISFLLLLLLMAKGYTITRARLKTCSTVKITIFINLYVVVYVSLYIYQAEAFDPGEVLNLYESPAGFGLAGLRCAGWIFFMYACAATIRKFAEKTPFYYPFTMLGSLWILSGPVLTLLGVSVLDPWVRESVMHGALGAVAFAGHLAFLWLTWPSRANRSFPYHVRTNHVGISHGEDDEVTYPKHPYEPATIVGN
ncbi:AGAP012225-PA, partial [Anopheles gambiae str. PEST]